jgi:hypothetical protein
MESRFTCWTRCLLGCRLNKKTSNETYDHYVDVKDKFPKEIEKSIVTS